MHNITLNLSNNEDDTFTKELLSRAEDLEKGKETILTRNEVFDEFSTKARFDLMASRGDRKKGLELLDK